MPPGHYEPINPYGMLNIDIADFVQRLRRPVRGYLIRVRGSIARRFGAVTQETPNAAPTRLGRNSHSLEQRRDSSRRKAWQRLPCKLASCARGRRASAR